MKVTRNLLILICLLEIVRGSIVVIAPTVDRWSVCTASQDCIQATDICCTATLKDKPDVKLCGPNTNVIVTLSVNVPDYTNYKFDCKITYARSKFILSTLVTLGLSSIINL